MTSDQAWVESFGDALVTAVQQELRRRRSMAPPIQFARASSRGGNRLTRDPDYQMLRALKKAKLWPLPEGYTLEQAVQEVQSLDSGTSSA